MFSFLIKYFFLVNVMYICFKSIMVSVNIIFNTALFLSLQSAQIECSPQPCNKR